MPHNLTEADVFTTPISVPDGLDSRNTAADVVDAIAQALTNRTHYLNLHAARTNAANTFTEPQIVDDDLSVTGDVNVDGDVTAENIHAVDAITAHTVDATADIYAGDDVIAEGEFQYGAVVAGHLPIRTKILPLFDSFGNGVFDLAGSVPANTHHILLATNGDVHLWPISLPFGATVTRVELVMYKPGAGPNTTMRIVRKQGYDWTNPVTAMPNDAIISTTIVSTGGDQMIDSGVLSQVIDNTQIQLFVTITAEAGDRVYGIRVTFSDPGPRNH